MLCALLIERLKKKKERNIRGIYSQSRQGHNLFVFSISPPFPCFGDLLVTPPCSQPLLLFLPLFTESSAHCPTPILWAKFSIPTHLCCLCYITIHCLYCPILLVGGSICPGVVLDYVPRRWVVKSSVVHVAHLLGLQVFAHSFETGGKRWHAAFLKAAIS
jgi:hypothetical protein